MTSKTTTYHPPHASPTEATASRIELSTFRRSARLAEIRAVYKSRTPLKERPAIRDSQDAVNYLRAVWNKQRLELLEDIIAVYLNASHVVIGWVAVGSGGINACPLDARIILAIALQTASTSLIVAHNHPSGNLQPSAEDIRVTKALNDGGRLLGIKLLDHIILTRDAFFSFSEHGLI